VSKPFHSFPTGNNVAAMNMNRIDLINSHQVFQLGTFQSVDRFSPLNFMKTHGGQADVHDSCKETSTQVAKAAGSFSGKLSNLPQGD